MNLVNQPKKNRVKPRVLQGIIIQIYDKYFQPPPKKVDVKITTTWPRCHRSVLLVNPHRHPSVSRGENLVKVVEGWQAMRSCYHQRLETLNPLSLSLRPYLSNAQVFGNTRSPKGNVSNGLFLWFISQNFEGKVQKVAWISRNSFKFEIINWFSIVTDPFWPWPTPKRTLCCGIWGVDIPPWTFVYGTGGHDSIPPSHRGNDMHPARNPHEYHDLEPQRHWDWDWASKWRTLEIYPRIWRSRCAFSALKGTLNFGGSVS